MTVEATMAMSCFGGTDSTQSNGKWKPNDFENVDNN